MWNSGPFYLSRITSRDIGQTVQPERLGIFTSYGETKHGRKVYQKQTPGQRDQFLYFWDWGPNNGGNWFVGLDPGINFFLILSFIPIFSTLFLENSILFYIEITLIIFLSIGYLDLKPRGIESPDLEKVMYENGICPTQAQLVAPFRVRAFWYNSLILNSNISGTCRFVIG